MYALCSEYSCLTHPLYRKEESRTRKNTPVNYTSACLPSLFLDTQRTNRSKSCRIKIDSSATNAFSLVFYRWRCGHGDTCSGNAACESSGARVCHRKTLSTLKGNKKRKPERERKNASRRQHARRHVITFPDQWEFFPRNSVYDVMILVLQRE